MNRFAKAQVANKRLAFFMSPLYRTLANPKMRLITPIACSTLARTLDLVRFLARSTSLTTPMWR